MATPYGIITIWSSGSATIPAGWNVCDGTNGTPDLRGYFVFGASSDGEVNVVSGCATHAHSSGATGAVSGHSHGVNGSTGNASSTVARGGAVGGFSKSNQHSHGFGLTTGTSSGHSHSSIGASGNTAISPPYYKLFYIMKI